MNGRFSGGARIQAVFAAWTASPVRRAALWTVWGYRESIIHSPDLGRAFQVQTKLSSLGMLCSGLAHVLGGTF